MVRKDAQVEDQNGYFGEGEAEHVTHLQGKRHLQGMLAAAGVKDFTWAELTFMMLTKLS
jgi:hypothetical protein